MHCQYRDEPREAIERGDGGDYTAYITHSSYAGIGADCSSDEGSCTEADIVYA